MVPSHSKRRPLERSSRPGASARRISKESHAPQSSPSFFRLFSGVSPRSISRSERPAWPELVRLHRTRAVPSSRLKEMEVLLSEKFFTGFDGLRITILAPLGSARNPMDPVSHQGISP